MEVLSTTCVAVRYQGVNVSGNSLTKTDDCAGRLRTHRKDVDHESLVLATGVPSAGRTSTASKLLLLTLGSKLNSCGSGRTGNVDSRPLQCSATPHWRSLLWKSCKSSASSTVALVDALIVVAPWVSGLLEMAQRPAVYFLELGARCYTWNPQP